MRAYRPRHITYLEMWKINDWRVKVYTINKEGKSIPAGLFSTVRQCVLSWLEISNGFNDTHHHHAFLIIHAGTEGVFLLINWWVDFEMLNTHIFLSSYESPQEFTPLSGAGLAPCIWEQEVISHECQAWKKHVLKAAPHADFDAYMDDVMPTSKI